MKKSIYALVILLLLFTLILAACNNTPATIAPATSTTTTAKPTSAPTTTATSAPTTKPVSPTTTTPQSGGTLYIILTGGNQNIGTLGAAHEAAGGMYARVSLPVMESLWVYDENEVYHPKLAESWDISADGKLLTIRVRKGVKFSDGTPWNAQALADNLKWSKENPTNPAAGASMFKNVAGWEVIDEYTVKVTFTTYDDNWMVSMAMRGIVSPTAAKKATTPENMAKDHMVGTGPFIFGAYKRPVFINYGSKNMNYWQPGKPYLDGIVLNQIDDPVTSIISFRKGEAQFIFGITPKDAVDLKKEGFQIILPNPASSVYFIVPDGSNPDSPFADIRVRQAAEYAINKKAIVDNIGYGYFEAATQFARSTTNRYVPELQGRNYDPAKAKQLLAEAGLAKGFKTTLYAPSTYNRDVLLMMQTYLKEVGIDASLDIMDTARFTAVQANGWKNGILCTIPGANGSLQSIWNRLGSQTIPSMYRGEFQKVLDAAISQPDYNKRLALVKQLITIIYNDSMVIPVWTGSDINAATPNLRDIKWSVGHANMWEPADAWLSK
jgi:ABC-type transport system substrate-binding protein